MTITELLTTMLIFSALAMLRFGLPMLIMWLFNQVCQRVLYVTS